METTSDRGSAAVLAAGAIGGIVTMVLHPTDGLHALEHGEERRALFGAAVHGLAVASLFLQVVGGWGVFSRLGERSVLARLGFAALAFAALCGTSAATISALTAPWLLEIYEGAGEEEREILRLDLATMHTMVNAFTQIFLVGTSVLATAWSLRMVRGGLGPKFVRILGVLVAVAGTGGLVLGMWQPTVHSLGVFMLGYGLWLLSLSAWLIRTE